MKQLNSSKLRHKSAINFTNELGVTRRLELVKLRWAVGASEVVVGIGGMC